MTLGSLKENVTKNGFQDLMEKLNSLAEMIKTALPDNSSQSSFSPSLLSLQDKSQDNCLASTQVCKLLNSY